MDSKIPILRPHQVPGVPSYGKRRGGQQRDSQRAFELDGEAPASPPDAEHEAVLRPRERSVTPAEPDETGAQLDVTA